MESVGLSILQDNSMLNWTPDMLKELSLQNYVLRLESEGSLVCVCVCVCSNQVYTVWFLHAGSRKDNHWRARFWVLQQRLD